MALIAGPDAVHSLPSVRRLDDQLYDWSTTVSSLTG